MPDSAGAEADTNDASPFSMALQKAGSDKKGWWDWLNNDPDSLSRFAVSIEGVGYTSIAPLIAYCPWEALPPNTIFVDVGSAQGSVALHVLRHVYAKTPTFKVVCQDLEGPIQSARQFWQDEFLKHWRMGESSCKRTTSLQRIPPRIQTRYTSCERFFMTGMITMLSIY
ncbi:hypothetical protein BD309DRAFT_107627 [Dichomitus squalens]|nr:hypothetical protein BD309DRAFT_107627 [Dichomitus squalens]